MSGPLDEFLGWLTRPREGVLPSIQTFPPLNIDQIANELRLVTRAKENGENNIPAQDSDVEDSAEVDILAEIELRARKAEEDYRSQIELYDGRIQRALISADKRALIDAAGENALSDFKVQATDDLDQLYNASQEVKGRENEFETFRKIHNIVRLPNIVSSKEWRFRCLVLAVFLVFESIINGLFFAKGSEAGLIGGVTQAFTLSMLNVGFAVLYARYGLPLVHVRGRVMIVGILITLLFVIWVIGINLLTGHFRDLYIHNLGQVKVTDLLSQFRAAPLFLPGDVQSLLLIGLGILLNLASLIEAAGLDDLYPGYGAIGKRHVDANSAYADHKARCLAGLTQRRNSAIEIMSRIIEEIPKTKYELRLAVEGRSRLHENYRAYLRHLAESYARLLQRYREANVRARSESQPPPARFLSRPMMPHFLSDPPKLELAGLDEDISADVIKRMQHFIKAVNQQFEEEVQRYQTILGLTDRRTVPDVDA